MNRGCAAITGSSGCQNLEILLWLGVLFVGGARAAAGVQRNVLVRTARQEANATVTHHVHVGTCGHLDKGNLKLFAVTNTVSGFKHMRISLHVFKGCANIIEKHRFWKKAYAHQSSWI